MATSCSQCEAQLDPCWSFCPHCGAVSASHAVIHASEAPKREKSPVRGAFGGFYFGFVAAPVCIMVGVMLCLTGLGAFAGVPLIIVGICAPLIGSLLGLSELKGACPWCGTKIASIMNHKHGFYCHACSQKIEVRDHELVKAA
ncbi:MAG TPA: hypothetical protein VMA34_14495 [Terracidiphilus sp.]|nr:hypothetical protein [Terracidiphilus sp.]